MRERTDRARLRRFLRSLGRRLRRPVRFYLVGGAVMIDLGLRPTTLDIDYVAEADETPALDDLEQTIRLLKQELNLNVEPASPADFLPVSRSAWSKSRYVDTYGRVTVYYFHIPSLVIAKAARGFEQDFEDAEQLVRSGVVGWAEVEVTWAEMRASPTGWLHYEPADVEGRLTILRRRLERQGT